MLKKVVLVTVLGAGGLVALVGRKDAWDYLRIAYDSGVKAVDDQIPFDAKQAKLRVMLTDTKEGLKGSIRKSAELAVKLKRSKEEVASLAAKQELDKLQMTAIRSRLPGGSGVRLVSNTNLEALGKELADRMVTYRLSDNLLASKQAALVDLEKNQADLADSIRDRQNKVESLSVRLQTIEAKSETLKVQVGGDSLPSEDDLLSAQKLADELEMKLEVEQVILGESSTSYRPNAPISKMESSESAAAFDTLFGVTIDSEPCVTN